MPHNTIFPFYHLVSDDTPVYIRPLYPVRNIKTFRKDLEFLLSKYKPMHLADVQAFVNNGKRGNKPAFFLSFDDGLKEIYENVRPVLLEYGVPAAFFINPDFVGNSNWFYRFQAASLISKLDKLPGTQWKMLSNIFNTNNPEAAILKVTYGQKHLLTEAAAIMEVDLDDLLSRFKPYMTAEQIVQLHNDGFYIGGHSMDHPVYADLSLADQTAQTQHSMDYIHTHIHTDYDIFAFPFTEYGVNTAFFDAVKMDVFFGTAGMKNDPVTNVIHRIPMETGNYSARSIIDKQALYYMVKYIFNKNRIYRS